MSSHTRLFALSTALAAAALPVGGFAQVNSGAPPAASDVQAPPADTGASTPSYAQPTGDETIRGRIDSFQGAYNMQVRDDRGFMDSVQLQQGTVINPTGIRLQTGMSVTIHGINRGKVFAANVIETPYQQYGFAYGTAPIYPYPYPYAYPVYPYPYLGFGYPFGPGFGIGFGFGFGGTYYRGGYWRH